MFIAQPDATCLQSYSQLSNFGFWHLFLVLSSAFKVTLFPHKASPKDTCPKSESEFVDQVTAKLKDLEQQQRAADVTSPQVNHNNHLEISATVKLSPKSQPSR